MSYMDRTTFEYPLSRYQVMQRNIEVGGKIYWTEADLAILNVYEVFPKATTVVPNWDEKYVEGQPINISGVWYQNWLLVEKNNDEQQEAKDEEWINVETQQQLILNTNTTTLPNGNVIVNPTLDYQLSPYSQNVTILSTVVRVNGAIISPPVEVRIDYDEEDDVIANLNINQAILGDEIDVDLDDGTKRVRVRDNISVIVPYPQTLNPYQGQQVPQSTYTTYINQVANITVGQTNPFDIVFPPSPFVDNVSPSGS